MSSISFFESDGHCLDVCYRLQKIHCSTPRWAKASKSLLIALPYLVAKTCRKLVDITGRSLEAALNACTGMEPECINIVTHIIRLVIAELTGAVREKRSTLEDLKRAVLVED